MLSVARPVQSDLFGVPATPNVPTVVRIDGGGVPLSPVQREFNRLSALVARLRAELEDWQQFAQRAETRLAEETPALLAADLEAQRRLVAALEALLDLPQKPPLRARERALLTRRLLDTLATLLAVCPEEADLIATYDRHSAQSWAAFLADQSERDRAEMAFVESMATDAFGAEFVHAHGADSVDALFATVEARLGEKLAQEQAERASARSAHQRSRREAREDAARAQRSRDIRQSVREAYRQLVSALHPDREPDPRQRARKTALMQRINQAYGDNDLLKLLALQMEVEQLDDDALAALPSARLVHYIGVLKDQVRTLKSDIQTWVAEFQQRSGRPQLRSIKAFAQDLEAEFAERRQRQQALLLMAQQLLKPELRRVVVQHIAAQYQVVDSRERQEAEEAELELEMMLAFAQRQEQAAARQGRRKRR